MESFKTKTGRYKINHNASFKAKFCLCFKPVSSVDDDLEPATFSTIFSSALMADCREGTHGWRRSSKKKVDDNDTCFWQILKKAFNDTALMKKIKTRKAASKSKISRSSNMKFEKNPKQECKNSRSSLESSNSSLFTRSSLSSSANSSSSSQTLGSSSSSSPTSSTTTISVTTVKRREDPKLRDKKKGTTNPDDDNRTKALCYILVTSLLVLILWGKVFAIICISFWLYLLPRRSELSEPPGPVKKEEEDFDTVEYKKKVIMEGLLDRNRSRLISMDSVARPCA
ncbi:uncharacterized protein DDB_G0271670-like [Neltuma alba]|uniref:uncharacterized protein DDB_G0271670-like n=1 Tax=Neltuma alba TaxID=207710 RepID=UPI0010A444B7|nr:uncharacterized protein DDB_G0271670-like [Prosopis alba]XP_028807614.1 uncharacterized protein DDB_G0271670-like [Prosopis alba]